MIKTILLSFLILFAGNAFAHAQSFTISHQYPTDQGKTHTEISPEIEIKNMTNSPLELAWEITESYLPEGWSTVVCEYKCNQGFEKSSTFTLAPKTSISNFRVGFRPNTHPGIGSTEVTIYEPSRPESSAVKVMFAASARDEVTSTNNNEGGGISNTTQVYPNPAIEYIMLNTDHQNIKYIEIYNIIGRKVLSYNVNHDREKYDVSTLPRGLYMVRLLDANKNVIDIPRFNKNNP
ncbi:MAG: T9SS type A sorting domain-containing protein [Saprospiraceae bacterium]|nr:T9SS type A sorting domain-containing protein [Saprospiraceae bacterium]